MSRLIWIALLQIVIILSALQQVELGIFQESPQERLIKAIRDSGNVVQDQSKIVGSLGETLTHLGKLPSGLAKVFTDVVGGTQYEKPLQREGLLDQTLFGKRTSDDSKTNSVR